MKVKELVELLQKANQDFEVILAKDSEGNGHSPLAIVDIEREYISESTYYGGLVDIDGQANPNAVVLWPIN